MKIDHRSNGSMCLVRSAVAAILACGVAHAGAASAPAASQPADTASADAAATAANGPAAAAADASPPSVAQLQEVVVTGYRSSLEQALNYQA